MAELTPAAPEASRQLFENLWTKSQTHQKAILLCLMALAKILDKPLSKMAARVYLACLSPLTKKQLILAFSRAAMECKFFPVPALLRELAGVTTTGDPLAAEAKEELFRIVRAMRGKHGPKLRDIPGRVLYGTEERPLDEHGKPHHAPIRARGTPFPLSRRTEAALIQLGWGCKTNGIALIAENPIVARRTEQDGQYQTNRHRDVGHLLAKWTQAYREVA